MYIKKITNIASRGFLTIKMADLNLSGSRGGASCVFTTRTEPSVTFSAGNPCTRRP